MISENDLTTKLRELGNRKTSFSQDALELARWVEQAYAADALLGALIRAMPTNRNLTRTITLDVERWCIYTDDDLLVAEGITPESALRAAGITPNT